MIAILLYVVGLISAVASAVLVGFDGPAIADTLTKAYAGGMEQILPALGAVAANHSWALQPFLGGLLVMGFSRIMMLLGSINRALRGPA